MCQVNLSPFSQTGPFVPVKPLSAADTAVSRLPDHSLAPLAAHLVRPPAQQLQHIVLQAP